MPPAWKELGFKSYDKYIKSRLWWNIRQLIIERDGKCCQVCGTPSKTVHHIDYTKVILLGQGDQHELITLCEPCHNFVEQEKHLLKKKSLLNKLFTEHSPSTLDCWQVWAKQFNTDICYTNSKILEPKNHCNKRHKKKKKKDKQEPPIFAEKAIDEPKSELESLRVELDDYIKKHKKNKKLHKEKITDKDITNYLNNRDQKWLDNKVKYYNKLHETNIRNQLQKAFPYFIKLLLNHPECSDKLRKCIELCRKANTTLETRQEKRHRLEEQYQKQRTKKKEKLSRKLPAWTINHKAQSFQGSSPLTKHLKEVKDKKTQETALDKTIH